MTNGAVRTYSSFRSGRGWTKRLLRVAGCFAATRSAYLLLGKRPACTSLYQPSLLGRGQGLELLNHGCYNT